MRACTNVSFMTTGLVQSSVGIIFEGGARSSPHYLYFFIGPNHLFGEQVFPSPFIDSSILSLNTRKRME